MCVAFRQEFVKPKASLTAFAVALSTGTLEYISLTISFTSSPKRETADFTFILPVVMVPVLSRQSTSALARDSSEYSC